MARTLAILANLCLLGFVAFMFIKNGAPNDNEMLLVIGLMLAPVLSLVALIKPDIRLFADDNLFSLWVHRKKLEQKAQIRALDKEAD
jgi:hypothetical protein